VIRLLRFDSAEAVRLEAVTALVSLDFNVVAPDVEVAQATQQLIIERFYVDLSARVRAKIVAGFGTDTTADSIAIRKLLTDAFADPDYRVRHAAMSGVDKLDRGIALSLVVKQLEDPHRGVRAQAASVLLKFGPVASTYRADIEQHLKRERDLQVRELLQTLVDGMTGR
jgi:HEAT repeat protein